jgi:hypothetical protein
MALLAFEDELWGFVCGSDFVCFKVVGGVSCPTGLGMTWGYLVFRICFDLTSWGYSTAMTTPMRFKFYNSVGLDRIRLQFSLYPDTPRLRVTLQFCRYQTSIPTVS